MSWQVTADGARMIGHVILQKSFEGEELISVAGGKLLANGNRGAVIESVKCGSVADLEGHILPGEYRIGRIPWQPTHQFPSTLSTSLSLIFLVGRFLNFTRAL